MGTAPMPTATPCSGCCRSRLTMARLPMQLLLDIGPDAVVQGVGAELTVRQEGSCSSSGGTAGAVARVGCRRRGTPRFPESELADEEAWLSAEVYDGGTGWKVERMDARTRYAGDGRRKASKRATRMWCGAPMQEAICRRHQSDARGAAGRTDRLRVGGHLLRRRSISWRRADRSSPSTCSAWRSSRGCGIPSVLQRADPAGPGRPSSGTTHSTSSSR